MASTRRPTALGPVPAPDESASGGGKRRRVGPADEEDERTTVDEIPPRKLRDALDNGWEERTVQDRGTPRPQRIADSPTADPADADSLAGTIDRGLDSETIEETTVDGGGKGQVQVLAVGSNEVGLSTVDEPTRDEGRRPLPPLAVVGTTDDDDDDARPTRVAINATLVVIGGNDRGREFQIHATKTTVGRGVDNDIVLTDIAVSRRHFTVEFDGKGFLLRDLNSGNGTLVNNHRKPFTRLDSGDQLEVGNTLIRFECPQGTAGRPASALIDDDDIETFAQRPPPRAGMPLPAAVEARAPLPRARQSTTPGPVPGPAIAPVRVRPQPTMPIVRRSLSSINGVLVARSATPLWRKILIGVVVTACLVVLIAVAAAVSGDGPPAPSGLRAVVLPGFAARDRTAPAPAAPAKKQPAARVDWRSKVPPPPRRAAAPVPVVTPAIEPAETEPAAPDTHPAHPSDTGHTANDHAVAKVVPEPVAGRDEQPKQVEPKKSPLPRHVAKKSPPRHKRSPPKRVAKKSPPKRVATTSSARGLSAGQRSTALKRAFSEYKSKNFDAAASTLRAAAQRADESDVGELESLANEYAAVGASLADGQKNRSANPPAALASYRKALAIDKRVGKGAHAAYLRLKLGEVAPKAAASFMAQRRYEAAKRACDSAVNYGAGSDPMVGRVRMGLDKKAAAFYQSALKLRKSSPQQATALLKRILKIVPPDSHWYVKSYALLNASKRKPHDDDE